MNHEQHEQPWWRTPIGIVTCGFLIVVGFFLLTEHTAHVLGALPWLLVLACPLMHLFILNPAVGAEQLGIGKISFRLLRASQAACNRRGGSSWRPLRYLTRARLRMRYHRSRSVNCSAVSRRVAKKAAMRVSARCARSRSP